MIRKIVTGVATGSILFALLTPLTFAETSIHIGNNGRGSQNNVSVQMNNQNSIWQQSISNIHNTVQSNTNTGNNRASDNHGNVSVHSGSSNSNVHIATQANMNSASIAPGKNNGGNSGNGNNTGNWMGNKNLSTSLSGNQEVPGPGDSNGYGHATVRLRPNQDEVCVNMHVGNIQQAQAAHIHKASAGASGPVVVTLPTPNAMGHANGCVSVDKTLIQEMREHPEHFYVNIHNNEYPNGAVRGQLTD